MDLKEKEVKTEETIEDKNIEKRFVKIVQKIITLNWRRKIFEEIEKLEFIGECKTAHDMIAKLDTMYLTQSTSLQIISRGKLEEVKLKNFDNVEDFFAEFEKAVNEFKAAGGKIEETEKMRYLIRALPPSYSYIGDFINVIPAA